MPPKKGKGFVQLGLERFGLSKAAEEEKKVSQAGPNPAIVFYDVLPYQLATGTESKYVVRSLDGTYDAVGPPPRGPEFGAFQEMFMVPNGQFAMRFTRAAFVQVKPDGMRSLQVKLDNASWSYPKDTWEEQLYTLAVNQLQDYSGLIVVTLMPYQTAWAEAALKSSASIIANAVPELKAAVVVPLHSVVGMAPISTLEEIYYQCMDRPRIQLLTPWCYSRCIDAMTAYYAAKLTAAKAVITRKVGGADSPVVEYKGESVKKLLLNCAISDRKFEALRKNKSHMIPLVLVSSTVIDFATAAAAAAAAAHNTPPTAVVIPVLSSTPVGTSSSSSVIICDLWINTPQLLSISDLVRGEDSKDDPIYLPRMRRIAKEIVAYGGAHGFVFTSAAKLGAIKKPPTATLLVLFLLHPDKQYKDAGSIDSPAMAELPFGITKDANGAPSPPAVLAIVDTGTPGHEWDAIAGRTEYTLAIKTPRSVPNELERKFTITAKSAFRTIASTHVVPLTSKNDSDATIELREKEMVMIFTKLRAIHQTTPIS